MECADSALTEIADRYVDRFGVLGDHTNGGSHFTYAFAGDMVVVRCQSLTDHAYSIYDPLACMIIQGSKELIVGEEIVTCDPGDVMIGSHELHVKTRIAAASPDRPYLAAIFPLDIAELRLLNDQMTQQRAPREPAISSLTAEASSPEMLNAFVRYLSAIDGRLDQEVVAPLIAKEIYYRLLTSPSGGMLRDLLFSDSQASRIADALTQIRANFRQPLVVAELASMVGLSVSSFHEHFKAVTGTTPLQYQKDLRLIDARQEMASDASLSASEAGYRVGYRSPTQFSREYKRKFGVPPTRDRARTPPTSV